MKTSRFKLKYDYVVGYLFTAPFLIGFVVFFLMPVVMLVYYSFTDFSLISAPEWTGVKNYTRLFTDAIASKAITNTLYYTVLFVPGLVIFSLFFAVLLNQSVSFIKGRTLTLLRAVYFFPSIAPWAAIGFVWLWLLNTDTGFINVFIKALGFKPIPFMLSTNPLRIPAMAFVGVWKGLGYMMFIFFVGLQNIGKSLYEAAEIDGASWWQKFRRITAPLVSPTTFFVMIIATMWAFLAFDQFYVMLDGLNSTEPPNANIMVFIYSQAFRFYKMGYASAASLVLFVITAIITLVQNMAQKFWVHY